MKRIAVLSILASVALLACTPEKNDADEMDSIVEETKRAADEAQALAQAGSPDAAAAQGGAASGDAPVAVATASPGWTVDACNYLPALATRGWRNDFEDEYGCSSPYKDIGAEGATGLPNNLAYYGYGKAETVERLKLVVNYNVPGNPGAATRQLVEQAKLLSQKAAQTSLPASIEKALRDGKAATADTGNVHHEVKRDEWPTGNGYEVHYILTKTA